MQKVLAVGFVILVCVTGQAQADRITIVSAELPPMMTRDGEGREAAIIRTALERCGHSVEFLVQPFTRHWGLYEDGTGDAVTTVPTGQDMSGSLTQPYIQYQNGVSYLSSRGYAVDALEDLAGLKVVAFEDASKILPGLKDASERFASYRETIDQIFQSRLLFAGSVDAVIGDGMLLAEYNRSLGERASTLRFDPTQPVTFSRIFRPSDYVMAFRDPSHAADFNRCFAEAAADGTIDAINRSWVDRYRDVLGSAYLDY